MAGKSYTASDISTDGINELWLFWRPNGPLVDVSMYIHEIEGGKKAELKSITEAQNVYTYVFEIKSGGNILSEHTEYFDYQLPPPPKTVKTEIFGGASKANAATF